MKVQEIMNQQVVSVETGATLLEVADLLHTHGISGVPVVNEGGIVQGLITEQELFSGDRKFYLPMYARLIKETDFVMGAKQDLPYEAGRIARVVAREIMNKQVFFAAPDMEIEKLLPKVAVLDQNIIPVVDTSNKLLGIISKGDLLRLVAGVDHKKENQKKDRYVDKEFDYVAEHMNSRFSYIAKARANVWLITATVLFIIGFLAGMVYVVNPSIFHIENNKIKIEAPQQ